MKMETYSPGPWMPPSGVYQGDECLLSTGVQHYIFTWTRIQTVGEFWRLGDRILSAAEAQEWTYLGPVEG